MGELAYPGPPVSPEADGAGQGDLWVDSEGEGWAWSEGAWVNVGESKALTVKKVPQDRRAVEVLKAIKAKSAKKANKATKASRVRKASKELR